MGRVLKTKSEEVDLRRAMPRSENFLSGNAVNPIAQGLRYRAPSLMIPEGCWKNFLC